MALLTDLAKRNVQISATGEQLDVRAPKGALTPELREQIAKHKPELLSFLKQRSSDKEAQKLPTVLPEPARRHEPFPLTDIQQAYWIGRSAVFHLGDVSIHIYWELDCQGLDLDRLGAAWRQVIARHDMLRAVVLSDGQQQILREVPAYTIEEEDLRGCPQAEVDMALAATRERMSHQLFQADQWPMFDVRATKLDGDRTRLHVSVDLLHVDGGSLFILNQDWVQAYLTPERPPPALELSYRDYVLAEVALRETELYRRSLTHWRERVKTLPPAPALPLARDPATLSKTRFVRRTERLSAEAWGRVTARASALGLSPSAVLLTAYAEVLAAWSKHPSFTINVTLFNRLPLHPQVNSIIGDFTSMILLGVDAAVVETFAARVGRVQEQLWSDLEARYVSGVEVQRELARAQGTPSANMPVVFTSMLNLGGQGYRPPETVWKALGELVCSLTQTPQVWLDCQAFEDDGQLIFLWDAVEDLFPPGMLDAMFTAFCDLLARLTKEEGAWQGEPAAQRVLPPEEQLELRARMNATDAPVPDEVLPSLLAAQASRRPDAPAVIASDRTLSYRELVRSACQLSHELVAQGVRPGALVAVAAERGYEQVIAVYSVLCAGAAYLPIDPEVPAERLRYLLEQSEVRVALTQRHLDARLSWPEGFQRVLIEANPDGPHADAPAAMPRPDDLAYVLYTSGSTGLPKGVMIEHRSVVNRILDVNERFEIGPADRAIALTALHHDLSVYDLFGVIAAGGTIIVPDAASARDPIHWAERMVAEGVTLWNSVPAFCEMLTSAMEHEEAKITFPSLRLVLLAGDWIPVTLPRRLWALASSARFISLGGPTETTVWDICHPVDRVDPDWPSIPYGRPMRNARYHVLNEALEPCPTWVPGQLYIGGVGLARGYFRDEARTQASFILHPRTGERLYRSGDMGRYLPDGEIEFLGREDFQVKIQGQRIELGEIEATLARHPAVRHAVAMVAGDGVKRLVTYVVPVQTDGSAARPDGALPGTAALESSQAGVLSDPLERVEFKLRRLGLRPIEPNMTTFDLGKLTEDEAKWALYASRSTHRSFDPDPLPIERVGRLLASLVSIHAGALPKHRYPSAGGLYPVRVYLHIKPGRLDGLPGGVYYHHPEEHRLVRISDGEGLGPSIHAPPNQAIAEAAAFTLFLVGHLPAVQPMYGEAAPSFCSLEAGYMGQLLMSEATACRIGLCPLGYVEPAQVREALALGEDDLLVHALLGGGISATQAETLAAPEEAAPARSLAEDLTAFLRHKLPPHMVPRVVMRDALPLTPNGKVDRKALAAIAATDGAPSNVPFVAPSDDMERTIAAIIEEVLQAPRVSVHQSFFDLGADSRHIVQIIGKLRQKLGVDIRLTEAFQHPTVNKLAAHLRKDPGEDDAARQGRDRAEARRASRERRQRR
nr:nonribosomal polypetide synthetase [Chondromyces crocatus]